MVRVALLSLLCALVIAGCVGPVGPSPDGASPACEELDPVGENLDARYNVSYERAAGFELSVTPETIHRGERFTATLRNVAEQPRQRGVARKYAVHRWSDGEWRPVLAGAMGYNATALTQAPNETYSWTFAANQSGLTANGIETCGPIETGRYRFVYFGITDTDGTDTAVAARFTVTEP